MTKQSAGSGSRVCFVCLPSSFQVFNNQHIRSWREAPRRSVSRARGVAAFAAALLLAGAMGASAQVQLAPITAGVVWGQGGSFTTDAHNVISPNNLAFPDGLVLDSNGNLYVADGANNRVLFFPRGSTTATLIYGQNGSYTTNYVNAGGLSATSLWSPVGLALDNAGNLYVADIDNFRVLFFPAGSTTATRVYGQGGSFSSAIQNNGGPSANSLNYAGAVAVDSSGNLYVADGGNNRVLFYSAGNTTATRVYGQGGSFTSNSANNGGVSAASLDQPSGLALDSNGNLYVADTGNNRVLFYQSGSTTATQVYGQGGSFTSNANNAASASSLNQPTNLALDGAGDLYVTDGSNNRTLFYPSGSTTATRVYGQGGNFSSNTVNNGGISANSLSAPSSIALDSSGNVYVADSSNNRVLEYGPFGDFNVCPSGQSTPAPCSGTFTLSYYAAADTTFETPQVVTQGATGLDFQDAGGDTCTGSVSAGNTCTVNVTFAPQVPGLRTGAVQLSANVSGSIALVASTPIYGVGGAPLASFSPITTSVQSTGSQTLLSPEGVAVDAAGDLFIANSGDNDVVKVAADGTVTTLPAGFGGDYPLNFPESVAVDGGGDVFIGLYGPYVVEVPAGCTQQSCVTGLGEGSLAEATAVAVDAAGDLFVGDQTQQRVVEFPASNPGSMSVVYHPGGETHFEPTGLAVDLAGDVYVADFGDKEVLEIPAGESTPTVVGSGWISPEGVALDAAGDLYVADFGLQEIVEIPTGCTSSACQIIVATANELSLGGGSGSGSNFQPYGVAVDSKGDVYIADLGLNRVDTILQQSVGLTFSESSVGYISAGGPESIILQNIGNQALTATYPSPVITNPSFYKVAGSGTPTDCTTSFSLAAGADCNVSIDFDPLTSGLETGNNPFTVTGYAVFDDYSLNSTSAQVVSLTGTSLAYGTEYSLTVTEGGAGSGSVTDNISAINCTESSGSVTGTCSGSYEAGVQVTLTASAANGSTFVGWGGGACASNQNSPTCTVTMSQALNVSASFAPGDFATANVCPGGSGSGCSNTMTVTFTPTANVASATVQVVTQGIVGPDFSLSSTTCGSSIPANSSCTATITFTPQAPGLRTGAAELSGNYLGAIGLVASIPIYGVGQAPEISFGPAVTAIPVPSNPPTIDFSSQVTLPENVSSASGMTTDAAGNLYYVNGTSLMKLAPPYTGTPTTVATGFSTAEGVAIDGAGNFYVVDPGLHEVIKVQANCSSNCQSTFYSGPEPSGVAVDGQGDVFVADANYYGEGGGDGVVLEYAAGGGGSTQVYNPSSGGATPGGLAADAAGDLFIADNGLQHVVEVPVGCTVVSNNCTKLIGSGWSNPLDVAVDAAGDVLVADNTFAIDGWPGAGAVEEVPAGCTSSNCQFLVFSAGAPDPGELALTSTGQLFVATDGPVFEINLSQPPAVLNFGTTTVAGTISSPMPLTLQNIGNQALSVQELTLPSSPYPFDQVFSGNDQPADCNASGNFSLTAGQACTVSISFEPPPASVQEDYFGGYLTLTSDTLNTNYSPYQQTELVGDAQPTGSGNNTLNVTFTAEGSGTVIDNLSTPITDCVETNNAASGACSESYSTSYTTVTLTATASAGSIFVGWGGACSSAGTNAQCVVTMTSTTNVSAAFSPQALGSVNVCAGGVNAGCTARTFAVTLNVPTSSTVSTVNVVTQGQTGLDFTPGPGSSCPGFTGPGTCIENVDFAPIAPGLRMGAVQLLDSGGTVLVTQLISGVGQGPETAFTPATQTTEPLANVNYPVGVALDGAGDLYIANYGVDPSPPGFVDMITPGGVESQVLTSYTSAITSVCGSGLPTQPIGIAVDGAGDLFISDLELTCAVKVTPGGVQSPVGSGLSFATDIALDGAGDAFIADQYNKRVVEVTPSGVQTTVPFSGLQIPWGVAVDAAGDVFVTDGDELATPAVPSRVVEYSAGGNQSTIPVTGLSRGYHLAVDAAGDLFIADFGNGDVVEYSAAGVQSTVGTGLGNPSGVTVDWEGDVFIGDQGNQQVYEVSRSQPELWNFGSVNVNGRSNDVGYSIQNIGNQNLIGTVGSASANFGVDLINSTCTSTSGIDLTPGSTCIVGVYAQPTVSGVDNGSVPLSDNSLNGSPTLQFISLTVNGVATGPSSYMLTVTENGTGSGSVTETDGLGPISCLETNGGGGTGTCSATYPTSDTNVALQEAAAPGSTFIGWGGACSGIYYYCTVPLSAVTSVTATFVQGDFGAVSICQPGGASPCTPTILGVTFNVPAGTTIGGVQVVTQGATGLDFQLGSGSTCTGDFTTAGTCTVNVNFTPLAPGLRMGAVELYDENGNLIASTLVSGVGQAPEIAFEPAAQATVGSGLANPYGVAVDAAGDVFIGDYGNQRAVKIPAGGGSQTTIASGLNYPEGVAVDGAGNVYIADSDNSRVLVVPPGGGPQTTVGSGLNHPSGVAVDGMGDVFIADYLNNRVVEVPAGGGAQTTVGSGLSQPQGVAVDGLGNVYITDSGHNQAVKVTASGVQTTLPVSGLSDPVSIAVDAAGDVIIGNYNNNIVVELTAGGVQTTVPATGLNANILGVAVDGAGDIFIADFDNNRVVEMNRSIPPSFSFATTNLGSTSSDSPQTVAIQNVGNLTLAGTVSPTSTTSFAEDPSSTCPSSFSLAPGAICSEGFDFTPQTSGILTDAASFSDNTLNLASSVALQTVTLGGIGSLNGATGTVVPNVVGMTPAAAATALADAGLTLGTSTSGYSSSEPAGTVSGENPAAGTSVSLQSAVNLFIATGQAPPPSPNPLTFENNYFVTGDYATAGVTLNGAPVTNGLATGTIKISDLTTCGCSQGVPDGVDVIDAFLYWTTVENTATPSGATGTFVPAGSPAGFAGFSITGQQIGSDVPSYSDGTNSGTLRVYRADVAGYLQAPSSFNGELLASGAFSVSLPDVNIASGQLTVTEGASMVVLYRALVAPGNPNATSLPLKSVVIYDGSVVPAAATSQNIQGFYDAVAGNGELTTFSTAGGSWSNSVSTLSLGADASSTSTTLGSGNAYAAVIFSTPVTNSDNDGILDAWKNGPPPGDFFAGEPGYYDVKTQSFVPLPGAKHNEKDLFVQLDYMCGNVLSNGECDPTQENLFPSPDSNGQDPLAMVEQAFAQTTATLSNPNGIVLHLEVGNAVPETACTDDTSASPPQLCQFPGEPGVVGWKNSVEFSKLWPRNFASCAAGGDCTARFPYGQKDSYHYVLFGHSLAIPAWNSRFGSLTAISVASGVTTITTTDRGTGINECPSRITISGVLSNPSLNGVYNTSSCPDTQTIIVATPGVPNWTYSYAANTPPEPEIGITSGTVTSISGYSDLGGADSAVTLALWETDPAQNMSERAQVIAGTLFHEIGHTLGLSHGGLYFQGGAGSYIPTFDINCKPNFQSSMNYLFQLDGVGPNAAVAYSNQMLETLQETSLQSIGDLEDVNSNFATYSTSAWYAPAAPANSTESAATLHCDGTPLNAPGNSDETGYLVQGSVAPVTPAWADGQDITFDGQLPGSTGLTGLPGYNDWTNIDLRQVGATGGEFASLASVVSFGNATAPLNVAAGGSVSVGAGGTVTVASGGTVTLNSGGSVTVGSGAVITNSSSIVFGTGGTITLSATGSISPGTNGTIGFPNGGMLTLSSTGTITLTGGGTVTLAGPVNVTLSQGGTLSVDIGSVTIPSTGGTYNIDSNGATITLLSGESVTLNGGGAATLGGGGAVTLGGGAVTLGGGGAATLGAGGAVTLGGGGAVTLGGGGAITLGAGGTVTLSGGGAVTLGGGGAVTLGGGGAVTLGGGGAITLGAGGAATLGAGGTVTVGAGGSITLPAGGAVTLGGGGVGTISVGGASTGTCSASCTLPAGGTLTLTGGGTVTLTAGGAVTLGGGGAVTLGGGGAVTLGGGGAATLGGGGAATLGGGGAVTTEMDYDTANSVVRPPEFPTYTANSGYILVSWMAPAFGVVQSYTISREVTDSNGNVLAGPTVIGTVAGSNGNPPGTTYQDYGAPTLENGEQLVYTIATTLVPDSSGSQRSSAPSPPAVVTMNQTIVLGALQSSYAITDSPVTVTATAETNNSANMQLVSFSASGSCTVGSSTIASGVSSASVTLTGTGSCTITASQAGNITTAQSGQTEYNAATPASATFAITLQSSSTTPQVINFPALPNVQYGKMFTPAATDNSGLAITYQTSGPCNPNGTISGIGTCVVTATAPVGTVNNITYNSASAMQSFTIQPAVLTVTAGNLTTPYGQIPTLTTDYTITGFVNGQSSSILNGAAPALSTTATTTSPAAIYPINVAMGTLPATNFNYVFALVPGTLTITSTAPTVSWSTPPPASAAYGSSFTVVATTNSGGAITYSTSGGCTNALGVVTMTSSTTACLVSATAAATADYTSGSVGPTSVAALPGPVITVSPSAINFGSVNLDSISVQTVTVTNTGTAAATISTPIISILKAGNADEYVIVSLCPSSLATGKSCTIAVSFVAGAYYNTPQTATLEVMDNAPGSPQPVSLTATVLEPQAITFTTNPPGSAVYNSSFSVAASGGGSGNPVTFTSSGACSNVGASYTMTSGTGTCSVIANQAGNSTYSAAPQVTKTVTATLAAQTITFSSGPPATAAYGTSFTVTASASSELPVSYTSSGSCTNSGATYTVTKGSGTCSVIANQAGNSDYSAAPQVTRTATATVATQTISFTTPPPGLAGYKTSFTVAASASSGLAVSYTSSGSCSNSGATYTMTKSSGSCSVIVSQAGNSNYSAAPQLSQSVTATLAAQTITITGAPATAAYKTSFKVTATGGGSGNAVTFTSSGSCSNSGATYTMTSGTGTCSVIANQAGTTNEYSAAPEVTQTVTAVYSTATLTSSSGSSSINFGVVAKNSSSTQTATLTNTGTTPLVISSIAFTGTNPSEFTQTNTCPSSSSSLAAGSKCTISVTFKSSGTAASANLVVTDNTSAGTQTVTLSGS